MITSDDAVTDYIYTTYYVPLLSGRKNPDGSPISGTIYVPHEYTDYERVNNIYNLGFEIGVNSIRYLILISPIKLAVMFKIFLAKTHCQATGLQLLKKL